MISYHIFQCEKVRISIFANFLLKTKIISFGTHVNKKTATFLIQEKRDFIKSQQKQNVFKMISLFRKDLELFGKVLYVVCRVKLWLT